jgi:hypothetical protein
VENTNTSTPRPPHPNARCSQYLPAADFPFCWHTARPLQAAPRQALPPRLRQARHLRPPVRPLPVPLRLHGNNVPGDAAARLPHGQHDAGGGRAGRGAAAADLRRQHLPQLRVQQVGWSRPPLLAQTSGPAQTQPGMPTACAQPGARPHRRQCWQFYCRNDTQGNEVCELWRDRNEKCYTYSGLPPEQQVSVMPPQNATGVEYYRGFLKQVAKGVEPPERINRWAGSQVPARPPSRKAHAGSSAPAAARARRRSRRRDRPASPRAAAAAQDHVPSERPDEVDAAAAERVPRQLQLPRHLPGVPGPRAALLQLLHGGWAGNLRLLPGARQSPNEARCRWRCWR